MKQEFIYAVGFLTESEYHICAFFKDKSDAVEYSSRHRTLILFEFPNFMSAGKYTFFEFPTELDYSEVR